MYYKREEEQIGLEEWEDDGLEFGRSGSTSWFNCLLAVQLGEAQFSPLYNGHNTNCFTKLI